MYRRVGGIAQNWPNAFSASVLMSDDRSAVNQTNDFETGRRARLAAGRVAS
jgi:hypothetical protein